MKAFRAWALMLVALIAGCGDGSIQSPDFTPVLVSVRVVVDNSNPALGETINFQAIGTFTAPPGAPNETFEQIIADPSWSSSNSSIVAVNQNGVGTAAGQGTATITAESEGLSGSTTVVVAPPRLTGLAIQPPSASIPLGSMTTFFARGTYSDGVTRDLPPGTTVTWTPADTGIATLDPTTGVSTSAESYAIGGPVTIRATAPTTQGGTVSATATLTVTGATLTGVDYVKPAGFNRTDDDTYNVFVGDVPFEIYGNFSDGTTQQLTGDSYTVGWASDDATVLDNPDDANPEQFTALALGSAVVTGTVTAPPANPDAASATVNVNPVNEFCVTEFVNPPAAVATSASTACSAPACTIEQPGNIIDGNIESYGSLTVNLGLLMQASLGVDVYDTTQQRLVVGQRAGFVVSRPESLLSLDLLGSLSIDTLQCDVDGTCSVVESFDGVTGNFGVDLLGLIGGEPAFLVFTDELTQTANGMRLTYQAESLLALQSAVNVHTACPAAVPPQ